MFFRTKRNCFSKMDEEKLESETLKDTVETKNDEENSNNTKVDSEKQSISEEINLDSKESSNNLSDNSNTPNVLTKPKLIRRKISPIVTDTKNLDDTEVSTNVVDKEDVKNEEENTELTKDSKDKDEAKLEETNESSLVEEKKDEVIDTKVSEENLDELNSIKSSENNESLKDENSENIFDANKKEKVDLEKENSSEESKFVATTEFGDTLPTDITPANVVPEMKEDKISDLEETLLLKNSSNNKSPEDSEKDLANTKENSMLDKESLETDSVDPTENSKDVDISSPSFATEPVEAAAILEETLMDAPIKKSSPAVSTINEEPMDTTPPSFANAIKPNSDSATEPTVDTPELTLSMEVTPSPDSVLEGCDSVKTEVLSKKLEKIAKEIPSNEASLSNTEISTASGEEGNVASDGAETKEYKFNLKEELLASKSQDDNSCDALSEVDTKTKKRKINEVNGKEDEEKEEEEEEEEEEEGEKVTRSTRSTRKKQAMKNRKRVRGKFVKEKPDLNDDETRMELPHDEDSQSSTSKREVRKFRCEVVVPESTEKFAAEKLIEYQWPTDFGEHYFIQEHVSEYLGIMSFKRKYPNLRRHPLDMQERDYLREQGIVSEMACDLGLTAVRSEDALDVMFQDFPDKFEELQDILRIRHEKDIKDQGKVDYQVPDLDKSKMHEYSRKAAEDAARFNANLNKERREERRYNFDMQTFTLQIPHGRRKIVPAEYTKLGNYPIAVLPGQYTDYYKM